MSSLSKVNRMIPPAEMRETIITTSLEIAKRDNFTDSLTESLVNLSLSAFGIRPDFNLETYRKTLA